MSTENPNIEDLFSQLKDASVSAPSGVWEGIASGIGSGTAVAVKTSWWFAAKWWIAGTIAAAAGGTAVWYGINRQTPDKSVSVAAEAKQMPSETKNAVHQGSQPSAPNSISEPNPAQPGNLYSSRKNSGNIPHTPANAQDPSADLPYPPVVISGRPGPVYTTAAPSSQPTAAAHSAQIICVPSAPCTWAEIVLSIDGIPGGTRSIWTTGDNRILTADGNSIRIRYTQSGIFQVSGKLYGSRGELLGQATLPVQVGNTGVIIQKNNEITDGLALHTNAALNRNLWTINGHFAGEGQDITWNPDDNQLNVNVSLFTISPAGCTDTIRAEFKIPVASELVLPNSFTPDGDGYNDQYKVIAKGANRFDMLITDRSGKQVFFSQDPAIGWDGKAFGKICPSGTYYVKVNVRFADGREIQRFTDLYLLKDK